MLWPKPNPNIDFVVYASEFFRGSALCGKTMLVQPGMLGQASGNVGPLLASKLLLFSDPLEACGARVSQPLKTEKNLRPYLQDFGMTLVALSVNICSYVEIDMKQISMPFGLRHCGS